MSMSRGANSSVSARWFVAAHIGQGQIVCAAAAHAPHKFAFDRFAAQIDKNIEQWAVCALHEAENTLFGA